MSERVGLNSFQARKPDNEASYVGKAFKKLGNNEWDVAVTADSKARNSGVVATFPMISNDFKFLLIRKKGLKTYVFDVRDKREDVKTYVFREKLT